MSKFSERFKELRINHNLSQQELAGQLGISKSSVNMYERGEREPGLVTLEKIADYFNVDMDYLLGNSVYANKHDWLRQQPMGSNPQIKETSLPEGLSDVKQMLIEEILAADDADIADLVSYLKVKKGITRSDDSPF